MVEIARRLRRELSAVLDPGVPVALVDYPNHVNVGDAAMWLGTRRLLRDLDVPVAYVADQRGYRPEHLRHGLPRGPILLFGGGNFGDLYPKHQRLRERVVRDFPERRIIQLPQTISFDDPSGARRAGAPFRKHSDFTLMVRDRASLERYGDVFARDVRLVPDAAFGLGALEKVEGGHGILWLARTDGESVGRLPLTPQGVKRSDWPPPARTWYRRRWLSRGLSLVLEREPTGRANIVLRHATEPLFDRMIKERVATGVRLLSSSAMVVTDRLHGHILSLLCGIPAIVSNNRTDKVRHFFDTWTSDSPLAHWSESPEEAFRLAAQLRARPPMQSPR